MVALHNSPHDEDETLSSVTFLALAWASLTRDGRFTATNKVERLGKLPYGGSLELGPSSELARGGMGVLVMKSSCYPA